MAARRTHPVRGDRRCGTADRPPGCLSDTAHPGAADPHRPHPAAADVTTNASDALNYTPVLDQSHQNTGIHPEQALVDAGYCSETNLEAAKDRQLTCGTDTFMATGRLGHDEQVPPAPRGRIPKNATFKERMARKLRTKPGRKAYSRRKAIVEPVFGQIMTCQNGRQLLLRGEDGARGEWRLLVACHNLRKIFRHVGSAGLAAAIT
ncbi:transposase [Streptomyces sp. NPDC046876]|uniref:transposase n=1 Tax=Streptomyces sp. NPDC046876 TaxID=3155616 RepID=UPI0033CCD97D